MNAKRSGARLTPASVWSLLVLRVLAQEGRTESGGNLGLPPQKPVPGRMCLPTRADTTAKLRVRRSRVRAMIDTTKYKLIPLTGAEMRDLLARREAVLVRKRGLRSKPHSTRLGRSLGPGSGNSSEGLLTGAV